MITSMNQGSLRETRTMIKIAMLSGLGLVLMLLEFPLPIFPAFLQLDLSDAPAIIGTFTMGPLAGVLIQLLRNLLKVLIRTSTAGVGEFAAFVVGVLYILPLGIMYQKWPNKKGVFIGSILSVLSMTIGAAVLNYYIFIPAFAKVFGLPIEAFVEMAASINANVVDLRTMIIFAIVPFNLMKSVIVSLVGIGLFKALKPLWKMY